MHSQIDGKRAAKTLRLIRAAMLLVLVFALLGIGSELVLLEHYEGIWQKTPLILIGAALLFLSAQVILRNRLTVRLVQLIMFLCVCGGCVGLYLHYKGNSEFELEMYPSRAGMELFWESLYGATPALAPGALIQVGLLGLVYTFRHPSLLRTKAVTKKHEGD